MWLVKAKFNMEIIPGTIKSSDQNKLMIVWKNFIQTAGIVSLNLANTISGFTFLSSKSSILYFSKPIHNMLITTKEAKNPKGIIKNISAIQMLQVKTDIGTILS